MFEPLGSNCIQEGQTRLAVDQWQGTHVFAIEMQKVEDKIDQTGSIPAVRRSLDHAERSDAVRIDAAKLAIEINWRAGSDNTAAASAGYLSVQILWGWIAAHAQAEWSC